MLSGASQSVRGPERADPGQEQAPSGSKKPDRNPLMRALRMDGWSDGGRDGKRSSERCVSSDRAPEGYRLFPLTVVENWEVQNERKALF